jgi:hypothetical protein
MSRKTLFLAAIAFACTFFISSCKKNDISLPFEGLNTPPATVLANVEGRVVDDNGAPVNGATITAGTVTTSTDINGEFLITGASLPQNAGLIKVVKAGFFNGFRTLHVSTSSLNYAAVQLIPKQVSGNFVAASGGNINANNGGTIQFSSNSIVNAASGAVYHGNVTVSAFFLNPADAGFTDYSPGTLRGIATDNNERGLQSFGMMLVELEGTAGEKLQVAPGNTATVNFPIAPALQGIAPATIPLWYFDENAGLWKEEGSAAKQGNNYTGNVKHFTFWNCDMPFPVINFEARYKDQNGDPLAFAKVSFTRPNGETRYGFTDETGYFFATLPAGELLVMKVVDLCNTGLFTQNVGQYYSNVNAGDFIVTIHTYKVKITGTAITCKGAPVANGVLDVTFDGKLNRTLITNGSFSISLSRCDNTSEEAQLSVFDIASGMQSDNVKINVTEGNINAGVISVCAATDQYMTLALNGENYTWLLPDEMNASMVNTPQPNSTLIESVKTNEQQSLYLTFPGTTVPGTYFSSQFDFNPTYVGETSYSLSASPLTIVITGNGGVSQYVTGSFSGNVYQNGDNTKKLFQVQGTFRVKRY